MQNRKEYDYEVYTVSLPDPVHKALSDLSTARKAVEIVRLLLQTACNGEAKFETDLDGADLKVTYNGETSRIEVKGTAAPTIAWNLLKVSSQKSHDALKSSEVVMYRVVDVDSKTPQIYVLRHGRDFYMEQESRWSVKPIKPENREKYPLRGLPYQYDDPYEPVALDDWEVLN